MCFSGISKRRFPSAFYGDGDVAADGEKRLICRESVAQDARLKRIVLTQKAVDLHRQIEEDIAGFEEMLAQGIPDEDQETFLRVAQKMRENLGDDISQKWTCKGGNSE